MCYQHRAMTPPFVAVLMAGLPMLASAAGFSGFDQFSGASKDSVRWGPDLAEGTGQLIQTNGRLQFVTSAAAGGDEFMAWPWQVGSAPWERDWSAQLDVQVPFIPLGPGFTAVGMGVAVINNASSDDVFSVGLEQVRSGGPQMRNFLNAIDIQGGDTMETSVSAPFESGSVQIRWSATNQTLSAWWDGTGGADGYTWTLLNTFNPALPSTWNMGPSNSFAVVIFGTAEDTVVLLTNQVLADNFYLQDETRTPLRIDLSATNAILSWPGEAVSFQLQSSLAVTGIWANVNQTSSVVNERREVTLPASGNQFFRLKKD
jgi:hypothetical protein